ncbi:homeobox protein onecut [Drosophila santomea]|uniref:homeobox protein onecut n=1 Tax=Drosophila santomea TaxID=129105 RepID=UPI001954B12D|nr:homeobox protein onecut [Drosophila santomea]XP_039496270.1 homeobox protein onecut [Drosophila santomea]XP_039496271.1 homeobox protein onecut [Drosophila santomea]
MDSLNEIIDHQTFSQELVEDASEFITVGQHSERTSQSREQHISEKDLTMSMQDMISCPRTDALSGGVKHRHDSASGSGSASGPNSVVMVIDSLGQDNRQPSYQIVPQQLQQRTMSMPFGLLQQDRHHLQHERDVNTSPVDFVSPDINLDGLTVDAISQTVHSQEMAIKQEQKLLIVQSKSQDQSHRRIRMLVDVSSVNAGLGVDDIDEISSDNVGCDDEGVTLSQHHQHILEQEEQFGMTSHHPHHQHHTQVLHSLHQRSTHSEMGLESAHGEVLSVIVHSQDSDKEDGEENGDGDAEGDADNEDDDERDSRSREQLLSHSSYQTLTSVNDRLSSPGFSQTSYATLTPIQPLPPISTMSEKFAYSGHISGGDSGDTDVNGDDGGRGVTEVGEVITQSSEAAGTVSISSRNATSSVCSNNDCSSFSALTMPMGSGHLSLGVLSGVQSPFSPYEKLSSLISSPPNNYLVSCDLHASVPGRVMSSHLQLSHNGKKESGMTHEHTHGPADINGGKFSYTDHISGGESGDTDVNGEKFSFSDHISGDSGDEDVNREKFIYSDHISEGNNGPDVNGGTNWLQVHSEREVRLHMPVPAELEARFHISSERRTRLNVPPARGSLNRHHAPNAPVCPANWKADDWKHSNAGIVSLTADIPVVVSLTPTPPPITDDSVSEIKLNERLSPGHRQQYFLDKSQEPSSVIVEQCSPGIHGTPHSAGAIHQQSQSGLGNEFQGSSQQAKVSACASPKATVSSGGGGSSRNANASDMEEINTKDLAQRISAELKRYSIPQAIFAQRVLCRSQGTLSDLLRNPKPWSKLKSGRETFRRMFKWLQEPEFQRMSALRMAAAQIPQRAPLSSAVTLGSATGSNSSTGTMPTEVESHGGPTMNSNVLTNESASSPASTPVTSVLVGSVVSCRRKEEPQMEQMPQPKKPRLVFTDLQRRTLQAIFKETKRPSKEMQVTIARQLGLEPTTVGNFFMNARRRSMDKWRDDESKSTMHMVHNRQQPQDGQEKDNGHTHTQSQNGHNHTQNHTINNSMTHDHYSNLHTTAMSPLGAFDEEADMDLELESHDFDLVDADDHGEANDPNGDML